MIRRTRTTRRRFSRNDSKTKRGTEAVTPIDMEIADRLLAFGRRWFGTRTIKDVFAWRVGDETRFAFSGPAEAMEARLGFDIETPLDNDRGRFDYNLAREFGVSTRWMGGWSEPAITHLSGKFGVGEMLGGVAEFLKSRRGNYDDPIDVTIITEPGYPWAGKGTLYYSARTKKTIESKAPDWIVPVVVRDPGSGEEAKRPGADWCALAPLSEGASQYADGYFTLSEDAGVTESVFVTHTIDLRPGADNRANARAILKCKGMLFPSLAVAPIPASNFGPCTLVADPRIVLRDLKPYKQPRSGMPQVFTYNTDAWTDVTREFVGTFSAYLYDQLTGNMSGDDFNYNHTRHLYILGPRVEEEDAGGFAPSGVKPIANTAQLARALKQRFRVWNGPMNERQFNAARTKADGGGYERTVSHYAYLEAKAHTIVPMAAFVAAWVPDFAKTEYAKFLRAAGFKGKIHVVETTPEERAVFSRESSGAGDDDLIRYNYAWKLSAAMRKALTSRPLMF